MNEINFLYLFFAMSSGVFGILITLIGWLGNRVVNKLDEISQKIEDVKFESYEKFSDLHTRISKLEHIAASNDVMKMANAQ
jgi:hypothetical protein